MCDARMVYVIILHYLGVSLVTLGFSHNQYSECFRCYLLYGNLVDINLGNHFMYPRKGQFEMNCSLTLVSFHSLPKAKWVGKPVAIEMNGIGWLMGQINWKKFCQTMIFLGIMICL